MPFSCHPHASQTPCIASSFIWSPQKCVVRSKIIEDLHQKIFFIFVLWILLGNSSASECYMPAFRNTLFHLHRQVGYAYEGGTECSETSAYKIHTPGNCPEESIQHSGQGKSLKWRILPRAIVNAPRNVSNAMIHSDLGISTVQDVIHDRSNKHRAKVQSHPNPLLQPLLTF